MDLLERESYECAIGDRRFRFEEFSEADLRVFVRRYNDLARDCLWKLHTAELADFAEAWSLVERENHAFFQWLLQMGSADQVDLEWVRANVPESIRRKLLQAIEKLNYLEDRVGNLRRLLIAAGRIIPGDASSTPSASATDSTPSSSEPPSASDKSSDGLWSQSAESGSTEPTYTRPPSGESTPANPPSSPTSEPPVSES